MTYEPAELRFFQARFEPLGPFLETAASAARADSAMTIVWFIVWLISDQMGDNEPLTFDPVNVWAATLILAFALDVNRPTVVPGRKTRAGKKEAP